MLWLWHFDFFFFFGTNTLISPFRTYLLGISLLASYADDSAGLFIASIALNNTGSVMRRVKVSGATSSLAIKRADD